MKMSDRLNKIPQHAVSHLEKFMNRTKLWPKSGNAFIAVSGGIDSMFLLSMMWLLKENHRLNNVTILHVNHGTRPGTLEEENFLKNCARFLNLPIKVKNLKLDPQMSNFENEARKERYKFFEENIGKGDMLYLGHHIDDSLEWKLLCSFKSGSGKLGMPLIRNQIARPLFCFTRSQIESMIKRAKIQYFDDPSNLDTKYERNFVRHEILERVKSRFPAYLKQYVRSSNTLAAQLGVSRFNTKSTCDVHVLSDCTVIRVTDGFPEEVIKTVICNHSHSGRGSICNQLEKLKQAMQSGKRGPLNFSGGVDVHIRPGYLYVMNGKSLAIDKIDEKQEQCLKTSMVHVDLFPYFFTNKNKNINSIDPLFPKSTKYIIENNINVRLL